MTDKIRNDIQFPLVTRRRFLKGAGAVAIVATTGLGTVATADDLPHLTEDDPTAKALNYVHDGDSVDAAKRAADRYCNNCALYAGSPDDAWAACAIFPGKAVAGPGWCSAWAPKPTK